MDPPRCRGAGRGRGLPRTRGDGPLHIDRIRIAPPAPPHTRGWTAGWREVPCATTGSPAHAGMDPRHRGLCTISSGLPRTRGDGPQRRDAWGARTPAPPHTRGWTGDSVRTPTGLAGSPAHAGMDLKELLRRVDWSRLPRTRGDGPLHAPIADAVGVAPPHTRGWTRNVHLVTRPWWGSPAHAGMDPRWRSCAKTRARLPRTRGDGPPSWTGSVRRGWAPPHTRGWTRAVRGVDTS